MGPGRKRLHARTRTGGRRTGEERQHGGGRRDFGSSKQQGWAGHTLLRRPGQRIHRGMFWQGNVYIWKVKSRGDVADLEALQKIPAHSKYITKALLSPDTK